MSLYISLRWTMTNLVFEKALGPDDLLEEVLAHVGIHSGQGVVQEVDV